MIYRLWKKYALFIAFLIALFLPTTLFAANPQGSKPNQTITPMVTSDFLEQAKRNHNWKEAFVTGKDGQVVFMNVSPNTNPNNEIGMETHPFDQIILIVQGQGKAILDGKKFKVGTGDMIFIPQGTAHNVINLNNEQPLKIISIYSDTDIPANSVFEKKSDEHTG